MRDNNERNERAEKRRIRNNIKEMRDNKKIFKKIYYFAKNYLKKKYYLAVKCYGNWVVKYFKNSLSGKDSFLWFDSIK